MSLASFSWWEMTSLSSQGAESSAIRMFLELLDRRIISNRSVVIAAFSGKTSLSSWSTSIGLPDAQCKMGSSFLAILLALGALSLSLWTRVTVWSLLALTLCRSVHFAISESTLSSLHLYRPSACAMGHPAKRWLSMQRVAPHRLQNGSSSLPHI